MSRNLTLLEAKNRFVRGSFSIRKARPDDAAFVLALFDLPHVREFTHGPRSIDVFLKAFETADREVLIIERDGEPVGNTNYSIVDRWHMEIRVIAVAQQRVGAGRFAMEWLLSHAFNELRVHRVFLEALEHNVGARALYESLGFRQEGCFATATAPTTEPFTTSSHTQ